MRLVLLLGGIALLADLTGLYSFWLGPSPATKDDLEILIDRLEARRGLAEVAGPNQDEAYKRLAERYDLGYALLYVEGKRVYVDDDPLDQCSINWDRARLWFEDEWLFFRHVHIMCEDVLLRVHGIPFKREEVGYRTELVRFSDVAPGHIRRDVAVWAENVAHGEAGLALAVGLTTLE